MNLAKVQISIRSHLRYVSVLPASTVPAADLTLWALWIRATANTDTCSENVTTDMKQSGDDRIFGCRECATEWHHLTKVSAEECLDISTALIDVGLQPSRQRSHLSVVMVHKEVEDLVLLLMKHIELVLVKSLIRFLASLWEIFQVGVAVPRPDSEKPWDRNVCSQWKAWLSNPWMKQKNAHYYLHLNVKVIQSRSVLWQ